MISSLHGKVESLGSDFAIINVGGIGFQVYMPTSTLSTLGAIGKEVQLYTHLHLREDNATLYGFGSADELMLFQSLISVSGLGPKLALAMLSGMRVEQLVTAIATGGADLLTVIPGIGRKVANRIAAATPARLPARRLPPLRQPRGRKWNSLAQMPFRLECPTHTAALPGPSATQSCSTDGNNLPATARPITFARARVSPKRDFISATDGFVTCR